ncbi:protein-L-isoaspartate(D-aspartate) O-methyltransferase [Luethyella okanaganae]|uniref:Protein-L-isoaspartate O-methyltransferase n=1 Tax=Luethyella okanaganae TaxID=69372 RepID=A0ABW1VHY7_9MICO
MSRRQLTRERMVAWQIERRGIRTPSLLAAMATVPREEFVPADLRPFAYDDRPLPIGERQTISQPYIVALMIEAAHVAPDSRVLEIGTGSGYAAAVLGTLCEDVVTIERIPELADQARSRLVRLGYGHVSVVVGDGTLGLPDDAPFDAIICAAAGPEIPTPWKTQLAPGGRIVMPLTGSTGGQELVVATKSSDGEFSQHGLGGVTFVPLIGEHGWS